MVLLLGGLQESLATAKQQLLAGSDEKLAEAHKQLRTTAAEAGELKKVRRTPRRPLLSAAATAPAAVALLSIIAERVGGSGLS